MTTPASLLALSVSAFLLLGLPAAPGAAAELEDRLQAARTSLTKGEFAKALSLYQRAVADSATFEAVLGTGTTMIQMGDWIGAEKALLAAKEKFPNESSPAAELANLYLRRARFADAAAILADLRQRHPDDGDLAYGLSWALAGNGKIAEAPGPAHDALAMARPCSPSGMSAGPSRIRVHVDRNGFGPFDDDDTFVDRVDVLMLMGRLERERGDASRSIAYLRQARAEARTRPDVLAALGRAYLLGGFADSAAAALESAADIDPDDPALANDTGVAFALAGDRKEANEFFLEAAEPAESPGYPDVSAIVRANHELAKKLGKSKGKPGDPANAALRSSFVLTDSLRISSDWRMRPVTPRKVSTWEPAKLEAPPSLQYPYDALSDRREGTVLLLAEIGADGSAGRVRVLCVDPALTEGMVEEAVRAVREGEYDAAEADKRSVSSWLPIPIAFRLPPANR